MNETALPPGLVAITGDEGSGKTALLRRIGEAGSALWLDLSLPQRDDETPKTLWNSLRPAYPQWDEKLQQDMTDALGVRMHMGKKLFMLSTGSRRKVALVALIACGARNTCLDQPFAALDTSSIAVLREFFIDIAETTERTWIIADYEANPHLPWRHQIALERPA